MTAEKLGVETRDTLDRQLVLMEIIAARPEGLTFMELQKLSALPKASLHRLLKSLIRTDCVRLEEFLVASPTGSHGGTRYRLGDRIQSLLRKVLDPNQALDRVQMKLHELAKEANETAFLSILRGDKVENLVMASPNNGAHGYVSPGRVMAPNAAAAAKAIFAYQPEKTWDDVLSGDLPALTDRTTTDVEKIKGEYREIRSTGIAYCREEIDRGLMALAAPVSLDSLGVIYAVSIVGPSVRIGKMDESYVEGLLREVAETLSNILRAEHLARPSILADVG